jgi:protein disulfide-isomerase
MRTLPTCILVLFVSAGGYAYSHDPQGCRKLGDDLKGLLTAVFTPSSIAGDSSAQTDPAAGLSPASDTSLSAWKPPMVIPSELHWNWTTSNAVYREVKIVKIEADCVTILHADGGCLVPISTLSPDLKKQLNYDPAAAAAAASQRRRCDEASRQALAWENAVLTDYKAAFSTAQTENRLVLLYFTVGDSCPNCVMIDNEVLASSTFQQFSLVNYTFVTVNVLDSFNSSKDPQHQNVNLANKLGINSFPTLVVMDANQKELGRIVGYSSGRGADNVILELKSFTPHNPPPI